MERNPVIKFDANLNDTIKISTIESLRKGSKMAPDFENNLIAQKVAIDIIIS